MMNCLSCRCGTRPERGFTLVELMISVALSLMILAGLASVFVNNSVARKEIERTTRQIENGRYAVELLANSLALVGFYAEFNPTLLAAPGAAVDPCSADAVEVTNGLAMPIQGFRSATASTTGLSCLTDLKAGTDVIVVRRTSTCVAGTTGCDALSDGAFYYFQASLCNPVEGTAELAGAVTDQYRLNTAVASLDRHKRTCTNTGCDCTTPPLAEIRRYHTDIYYVANNSVGSSDGIPTLKRAELNGSGFTIVPLVEGIENLKVEYGIDAGPTFNGMPDIYTADPDTYNCTAPLVCSAGISNWRNVTAVRLYVLARNTEPSPGYTDTKTYTLDGATTVAAQNDAFRRHVFTTTVKLVNVAGHRE